MNLFAKDERRGLPSGSELQRLKHCPGSFRFGQALELMGRIDPHQSRADADEGKLLHSYMTKGDALLELGGTDGLNDEQEDTVKRAWVMARSVLALEHDPEVSSKPSIIVLEHEERIFLYGRRPAGRKGRAHHIASGQLDLFAVLMGRRGIIIDYKFGRIGAGAALDNDQLEAYIAIASRRSPSVKTWDAALIQPRLPRDEQLTLVRFGPKQVRQAHQIAVDHFSRALQPGLPLGLGPGCKYCPCAPYCPEKQQQLERGVVAVESQGLTRQMADHDVRVIKDVASQCEKLLARAKAQKKADPGSLPGYELKPGASRPKIDAAGAVLNLQAALPELTNEELLGCMGAPSIAGIRKAVRKHQDVKGEALKRAVDDILGDALEYAQNEPSLVEVRKS